MLGSFYRAGAIMSLEQSAERIIRSNGPNTIKQVLEFGNNRSMTANVPFSHVINKIGAPNFVPGIGGKNLGNFFDKVFEGKGIKGKTFDFSYVTTSEAKKRGIASGFNLTANPIFDESKLYDSEKLKDYSKKFFNEKGEVIKNKRMNKKQLADFFENTVDWGNSTKGNSKTNSIFKNLIANNSLSMEDEAIENFTSKIMPKINNEKVEKVLRKKIKKELKGNIGQKNIDNIAVLIGNNSKYGAKKVSKFLRKEIIGETVEHAAKNLSKSMATKLGLHLTRGLGSIAGGPVGVALFAAYEVADMSYALGKGFYEVQEASKEAQVSRIAFEENPGEVMSQQSAKIIGGGLSLLSAAKGDIEYLKTQENYAEKYLEDF